MKTLIIVFCLLFASTCYGELYLVVDKSSKSIITASEKNDTVLSANQELVILPGEFENYELSDNVTNYKYNKKFILDTTKVQKQIEDKQIAEEKKQEEFLIQTEMRAQAITALKNRGVELKYNE